MSFKTKHFIEEDGEVLKVTWDVRKTLNPQRTREVGKKTATESLQGKQSPKGKVGSSDHKDSEKFREEMKAVDILLMIFKRHCGRASGKGIRKRSVRKGWDKGLRVKGYPTKAELRGMMSWGKLSWCCKKEVVGVSWGHTEILLSHNIEAGSRAASLWVLTSLVTPAHGNLQRALFLSRGNSPSPSPLERAWGTSVKRGLV